ncbi:MAG: type II secretion system protein GspG [Planctomycetota bacterium]|nr:MAG: type II secretion system protein GspG [Planctomycetota bacterium]
MKSTRNKTRRRTRGFTLMEMLLVLAILVALMALVGPRILGTQKKSDISTAKAQLGLFKAALERYSLDMRKFPTSEEGLASLIEKPAEDEKNQWDGPYLDTPDLPKDPWNNDYRYEFPPKQGQGDSPDLWSLGPDGEDGTDDDIVNWKKRDESTTSSRD